MSKVGLLLQRASIKLMLLGKTIHIHFIREHLVISYTKSSPSLPRHGLGNFATFLKLITNPYISAKNKDIVTKLSGYDQGGSTSSLIM